MKIDFEGFLMEKHSEHYMGTDDAMPDAFADWVQDLEIEDFINYGNEYCNKFGSQKVPEPIFITNFKGRVRKWKQSELNPEAKLQVDEGKIEKIIRNYEIDRGVKGKVGYITVLNDIVHRGISRGLAKAITKELTKGER